MKQSSSKTKSRGVSSRRQKTGANGKQSANGKRRNPTPARMPREGQREEAEVRSEERCELEDTLLGKFFLDQLKDIYYAESRIAKALPRMQEAATTTELEEAFDAHLHQTQKHLRRLEKVFEMIDAKPEGKRCEAIEGIAKEADTIIAETKEGSMTRDAALIIAAQKVEHYEIATYGGLVQLAITMGMYDVADLLDRTLIEEEATDALLTDIAESYINIIAEEEEEDEVSWEHEEQEMDEQPAEMH